jgi:single-strand selective monofunctional uracil DNA glycosylase
MPSEATSLIAASRELTDAVNRLTFGPPATHIYNPLSYARDGWEQYLSTYGSAPKRFVFLGMNPGPWGMAQVGVPFGEIGLVRDWLGIQAEVGRPEHPHPKRPILGYACPRSEVSGRRLWGLMQDRFGTPQAFFTDHFVANYCPLVFMGESGRNITPDKLPAAERDPLFAACDAFFRATCEHFRPEAVIGIGAFATTRAQAALSPLVPEGPAAGTAPDGSPRICTVLHPSPASPAANRGWAEAATKSLIASGIWKA